MKSTVFELEKLLKKQGVLYTKYSALEDSKSDYIMLRDRDEIEHIIMEQEKIISAIDILEKNRIALIEKFTSENYIHEIKRDATLSEIVRMMDEDSAHRIMEAGQDLRRIVESIKILNETNQKLIKDNLDFFNILVSGIRETLSGKFGYSSSGEQLKLAVTSPAFLNKRA